MQNLHNSFLLIFFISDLIRDERYVYYYLHIFHLLWDLIWYWHQTSTFPSLLAHLSICALPWMYKLHTLKASCLFLHFLIGWMGQSNFSNYFSWSFLKMEDLQLSTLHILVFFFSKTRKSMTMPISASKKENQKRRLFLHYKCCVCTKTVFSFLLDEIGWFKDNRQIYLQYIWRILRSSYRKLASVGFEPTTTEFLSDTLTKWAIRPWVQVPVRANFVQLLQFHLFHLFVQCSRFISVFAFVSHHICFKQSLTQLITL